MTCSVACGWVFIAKALGLQKHQSVRFLIIFDYAAPFSGPRWLSEDRGAKSSKALSMLTVAFCICQVGYKKLEPERKPHEHLAYVLTERSLDIRVRHTRDGVLSGTRSQRNGQCSGIAEVLWRLTPRLQIRSVLSPLPASNGAPSPIGFPNGGRLEPGKDCPWGHAGG